MSTHLATRVIQKLQGRPLVIFAAGGGAEAISTLQCLPGCSHVLFDAGVPYSREAVRDLIGYRLKTRDLGDGRRVGGARA